MYLKLVNFYVVAEIRHNSDLSSKPFAVVKRNKVVDASKKAMEWGIVPELSVAHASRLCPGLILLTYDLDHYRELYKEVWDIATNYSSVVETTDLDEGFIDLTEIAPCDTLRSWARKMQSTVFNQTKLRSIVGSGPNKIIARLASLNGSFISLEQEKAYLSPIQLEKIWWIDKTVVERLGRLGVHTIGELGSLPNGLLANEFNVEEARLLQSLSYGIDTNLNLVSYSPTVEQEKIEINGYATDESLLSELLAFHCDRIYRRLNENDKEATEVSLYVDFGKERREVKRRLLHSIRSREHLLNIVHSLFYKIWRVGITDIIISVSGIIPKKSAQLDLFNNSLKRDKKINFLESALNGINLKFGPKGIMKGKNFKDIQKPRMAQLILEGQGKVLL